MAQTKLFPLKLPENFHGLIKPQKTPSQLYSQKSVHRQAPHVTAKISNWKRKVLDQDIIQQRKEYIVHPAKISNDNPDWVKSTFHHFNRNYASLGKKETAQDKKGFDVFGNKKIDPSRYAEKEVTFNPKSKPQITPKIGMKSSYQEGYRSTLLKTEVAGKVGSLQNRESLIRRPQLKVGSLHGHNFIDTYTVN